MPTHVQHYVAKGAAVSSLTINSVVVGSGEGILAIVIAGNYTGAAAPTVSSVTFNSAGLDAGYSEAPTDAFDAASHKLRGSVFSKPNPSAATASVVATLSGSAEYVVLFVAVVSSPNTTAMIANADVFAVNETTTISNSLTTVSGELVYDLWRWRNTDATHRPVTMGAGQTELVDEAGPTGVEGWCIGASREAAAGSSTTMSATYDSGLSVGTGATHVIVSLAEAAASDPLYPPTVSQSVRMQSSIASAAALNSRRYG